MEAAHLRAGTAGPLAEVTSDGGIAAALDAHPWSSAGAGARGLAAVEVAGAAVARLAARRALPRPRVEALVDRMCGLTDLPPYVVRVAIHARAACDLGLLDRSPRAAAEAQLLLVRGLVPASEASLWVPEGAAGCRCLVGVGSRRPSPRVRCAAAHALRGVVTADEPDPEIHTRRIEHGRRPAAVMVVRTQRGTPRELDPILDEAAGHLAPILERKAVSDRVAAREQTLLTSAARRLVDLGFDLHDGPMQSLVALGYEVDRARRRAEAALPADAGRDVVDRLDRMLEILGHLEGELRSVVADLTPLAIFKDARSASAAVGVSNGAPSDREVDHASAHR